MGRIPTPWFWEERNGWYVTKDGKRHFLGEHPTDAPPPKKAKGKWNAPQAIRQAFHDLMAERGKSPAPDKKSANSATGSSVAELIDKYLDWCQKHRKPRTYEWYRDLLQAFLNRLETGAELAAAELKPYHLLEWVDAHPEWSQTYRRNAIAAVKRVYAWAEEMGYQDTSPVRKVRKPMHRSRTQAVTPEQWAKIRDHYAEGDPFRDLLEFCWETGCRPQEATRVEARHADISRHRIVFAVEEAKGGKKARIIYLTPRAEEVLSRRLASRDTGPLLCNEDGKGWTRYAIKCRFARLQKHLGVRFAAYSLRHGFATRKLVEGMDHLTVAALMGHADGSQIAKTYSHISDREDYLRQQLLKGEAKA